MLHLNDLMQCGAVRGVTSPILTLLWCKGQVFVGAQNQRTLRPESAVLEERFVHMKVMKMSEELKSNLCSHVPRCAALLQRIHVRQNII